MIIKLFGGIMVFSAGLFWGMYKSGELLQRVKSIRNIKSALAILESEIVFSSHYLRFAFERISKLTVCGELFSDAADKMDDVGVSKAWRDAVRKNRKKLALTEGDTQILELLTPQLGMSDTNGQSQNIRHILTLLDAASAEAEEEYSKSARLYRSMGILGGLLIVILLV